MVKDLNQNQYKKDVKTEIVNFSAGIDTNIEAQIDAWEQNVLQLKAEIIKQNWKWISKKDIQCVDIKIQHTCQSWKQIGYNGDFESNITHILNRNFSSPTSDGPN